MSIYSGVIYKPGVKSDRYILDLRKSFTMTLCGKKLDVFDQKFFFFDIETKLVYENFPCERKMLKHVHIPDCFLDALEKCNSSSMSPVYFSGGSGGSGGGSASGGSGSGSDNTTNELLEKICTKIDTGGPIDSKLDIIKTCVTEVVSTLKDTSYCIDCTDEEVRVFGLRVDHPEANGGTAELEVVVDGVSQGTVVVTFDSSTTLQSEVNSLNTDLQALNGNILASLFVDIIYIATPIDMDIDINITTTSPGVTPLASLKVEPSGVDTEFTLQYFSGVLQFSKTYSVGTGTVQDLVDQINTDLNASPVNKDIAIFDSSLPNTISFIEYPDESVVISYPETSLGIYENAICATLKKYTLSSGCIASIKTRIFKTDEPDETVFQSYVYSLPSFLGGKDLPGAIDFAAFSILVDDNSVFFGNIEVTRTNGIIDVFPFGTSLKTTSSAPVYTIP